MSLCHFVRHKSRYWNDTGMRYRSTGRQNCSFLYWCIVPHFLHVSTMDLREQLQATATLPPEKELQLATAQEAGWARQPIWMERKIDCCFWRETNPGSSLYWLNYHGSCRVPSTKLIGSSLRSCRYWICSHWPGCPVIPMQFSCSDMFDYTVLSLGGILQKHARLQPQKFSQWPLNFRHRASSI